MLALSHAARAQEFDPHYTGPYDTVHGKFFVRLYVVYAQTSTDAWADSLGTTELRRRTAATFALLNREFNKHDIFFVPGEGDAGTCHTVFTQENQEDPPIFSDGLTMLVQSDEGLATGAVVVNTLPAKYFRINGMEDSVPGSNLPVVIHEVGHCFGLAHTFDFTSQSNVYEGPDVSCSAPSGCRAGYGSLPDQCCGDMVGDTPKHGIDTVIVVSSDCQTSVTPSGVSLDIFRNYMSYSRPLRCNDRFSDQQVRRMRLYLKNSALLGALLVAPETVAADTVVWDDPVSKSANIIVPDGAVLVVDSVLEMAPGTYIVVRRGGTLIVNGLITAGCGGMWGGIVVEGASNQPQKDSLGMPSSEQGRFVLNSTGIVEHAVDGVSARGFEQAHNPHLLAGGIIEVFGRIRNCTNALGLYYYQKEPKANAVSGAFLTLDDDYRGGPEKQPTLLYMRGQTRLDLSGTWICDFRTEDCTGRTSRAKGLVADESTFQVRSGLFRYLDRGVQAYGKTSDFSIYTVENSSFFDCYTGIESDLPDNFRIVGNNFFVARPQMCPQESEIITGVRLFGYALPDGIGLANNYFYGGDVESDYYFGIDCAGTGSKENTIRHNTYWDLDVGNNAAGNNGGPTGLRYECNVHSDNQAAYNVFPDGSVRMIQGDENPFTISSTAAGNRFSGNGYTWSNYGAPITYYFWDTVGQVLTTGSGFSGSMILKEATFPNPNCSAFVDDCPAPCATEGPPIVWKDTFFINQTSWLTTKDEYDQLTDPEDQAALLPELNAYRSAMDYWGGRVIRDFALDSTGTRTDSVLLWTRHLRAYETDLRLARHAFFTGDLEGYDAWLDSIPARNDLSEAQADELDEFAEVLAVVRPYAEAETDLHRLPATALDSLEGWAENCNEPGFLARVLLLGNGREVLPNCGGGSLRPAQTTVAKEPATANPIRLYPNPTTGRFIVELPKDSGPVRLQVFSPDGRVVLEQPLNASAELDGTALHPGLYFCRIADASGLRLMAKLMISR